MNSLRRFSAYALALALFLAGCGPAGGSGPAAQPDRAASAQPATAQPAQPAPLQPADFAVGPLALGVGQEAVKAILGEPESTDFIRGPGIRTWRYPRAGVTVGFFDRPGQPPEVVYILIGQGFTGSTPRHIAIGSAADDVWQAYGANPVSLGDDAVRFDIQNGKVVNVVLGRSFDPYGSGQRWNLALPQTP